MGVQFPLPKPKHSKYMQKFEKSWICLVNIPLNQAFLSFSCFSYFLSHSSDKKKKQEKAQNCFERLNVMLFIAIWYAQMWNDDGKWFR